MTFLIVRCHARPGQYLNSPDEQEWKLVGAINAKNTDEALRRAMVITGETRQENLSIGGLQTETRE